MEDVIRRGRRPAELPETTTETTPSPTKRRRRASVGGHALKLQAPTRPGYTRRWFNDDGNRIAEAGELAYDFVRDPDAKSTDVGSRISRLVGTKPNGDPLRAFLMETPDELYAEGVAEREAELRAIDETIQNGQDSRDPIAPPSEMTGRVSIQRDR